MNTTYNLSGKTIVITGATSGIGYATARELAGSGAFVIALGRDEERCRQARENITLAYPGAAIEYIIFDLSSQKQVRDAAAKIRQLAASHGSGSIDVLINNAGAFSSWYVSTPEGIELQWAVNHLAPFLLTGELLPLIKAAPEGRILTISSGSHYRTRIHWKDVLMRKHYNCLGAYKQSKLANVLFTGELNRRLGDASRVQAFAIDPGLVNTDMGIKRTAGIVKFVWGKRRQKGVSPEQAAKGIMFAAADPAAKITEGIYWKNGRPLKPSRYAMRKDAAVRLWELSEKMCGIKAGQEAGRE